MKVVVKLGGSLITFKGGFEEARLDVIERVADEVKRLIDEVGDVRIVLIHGGGSFGHPQALKYRVGRRRIMEDEGWKVLEVAYSVRRLNQIVFEVLKSKGIPVLPIHAFSIVVNDRGILRELFIQPVMRCLDYGIIPLIHGDVAPDLTYGFSIVSGDTLAGEIAIKIKADKLVYGIDVDGVLDGEGKTISCLSVGQIERGDVRRFVRGGRVDATGGILGKLLEASRAVRCGVDVYVANLTREGVLIGIVRGLRVSGVTRIAP